MNSVTLIGRLTRDPDIRWTQGQDQKCTARFTLAVDRRSKSQDGQREADFISCTAFGKNAEFAEKYLEQGMKIALEGSIRTGSYTNKEGQKIYTTDVWVSGMEFVESKKEKKEQPAECGDGFMNIPAGVEDEQLPFN